MAAIGILADDLTGAMDTGAQLTRMGGAVRIAFAPSGIAEIAPGADCVVASSQSRNTPPAEARQAVQEAHSALMAAGCGVVYKKVDSTLRGNVGTEIEAFAQASGKAVLLAPALPSLGRTTKDGVHYVHGVPLKETDLAKDPFAPVRHSHIGMLLAEQTNGPSAWIPVLDAANEETERTRVQELAAQGVRIFYADAESQRDLDRLARWARPLLGEIAPCGSAGWMQSLAELLLPHKAGALPVLAKRAAPLLILSASPAGRNKEQIGILCERHPEIALVAPDLRLLGDAGWQAHCEGKIQEAARLLAQGRTVLVDAAAGSKEELLRSYGNRPEILSRNSDAIQHCLCAMARRATDIPLGALVLLGGDTALHVCQTLGATGLQIGGEALPYIPLGHMLGKRPPQTPVITKAGGFGALDALQILYERLCDR